MYLMATPVSRLCDPGGSDAPAIGAASKASRPWIVGLPKAKAGPSRSRLGPRSVRLISR